jgi:uncharacterized protein YkwD
MELHHMKTSIKTFGSIALLTLIACGQEQAQQALVPPAVVGGATDVDKAEDQLKPQPTNNGGSDNASDSSGDSTSKDSGGGGLKSGKTGLTSCYKGDVWICAVEAAIVVETNALRKTALKQSFEDSYVMRSWSDIQANRDKLGHDGFPTGREQVLTKEFPTLTYKYRAENVAMFTSKNDDAKAVAKQFVTQWYNSEGHRVNMLGPYTYIGVGVSRIGNAFYASQIFR